MTLPLWSNPLWAAQWCVVVAAALLAAVSDARSGRIPNLLTGPFFLSGLLWGAYVGGWIGLLESFGACILLAAPYVMLFLFAGGGAGDAKLMGAIGAWVGLAAGVVTLASVAFCGIILGVAFAIWRRNLVSTCANLNGIAFGVMHAALRRGQPGDARILLPQASRMQTLPYGLAIALGTCLAAGGVWLWRS